MPPPKPAQPPPIQFQLPADAEGGEDDVDTPHDEHALEDRSTGTSSGELKLSVSTTPSEMNLDVDALRIRAKARRWNNACVMPRHTQDMSSADGDGTGSMTPCGKPALRPVVGTTTETLGIYGVGVQLYFELLMMMCVIFTIRAVFGTPMLLLNAMGTGISDFLSTRYLSLLNRMLASTFLANIGSCPDGGCLRDFHNLQATPFSSTPLKEVAPWLGGLEGISSLLCTGFCIFFMHYWIPRTMSRQDENFVTAADFSICVSVMPPNLNAEHSVYEDKLKSHFETLLSDLGVKDDRAVQNVTLVREYDGALHELLSQGQMHVQLKNAQVLAALHKRDGEDAKAKKAEARVVKLQDKIAAAEKRLAGSKSTADDDRDVCEAYIMFNREEYKDKVLEAYSGSRSCWTRPCQDVSLRFGSGRIRVTQAHEPEDLRWENLDYHPCKRRLRQCGIRWLALAMIIILLMSLVFFRHKATVTMVLEDRDLWIFEPVHRNDAPVCASLCDFSLATGSDCVQNIPIRSALDADGAVAFDLTTSCWDSDGCTQTTPGGGWLGLQTDNLSSYPECVSFAQGEPTPGKDRADVIKVWGCYSALMDSHGRDGACVRMADLVIDPDVQPGSQDRHFLLPDTECGYDVSSTTAEHASELGAAYEDQALFCYCQQKAAATLYVPFFHNDEMCSSWLSNEDDKIVRVILGMLGVLALNQVMLFLFSRIGIFARYATETAATKASFFTIYWTQMLNTGFVYLLVGMNLNNTGIPSFLTENFNLGKGEHVDTRQAWFVDVGVKIFIALTCQAASVLFMPIFAEKLLNPFIIKWSLPTCVTEDTLCRLYALPEWQMPLRLAETMTIVTCVDLYAGCMPILYWLAALYCFVAYWVDKWTLLAKSKRPLSVGEDPVRFAAGILTAGVMLHMVMTMWVFGSGVLPSDWGPLTPFGEFITHMTREESDEILQNVQVHDGHDSAEDFRDFVRARILSCTHASCTGLLLAGFVALLYLVVALLLRSVRVFEFDEAVEDRVDGSRFARLIKSWGLVKCSSGSTTKESFEEASKAARKSRMLFSYRLQDNDRYRDVHRALHLEIDHHTSNGSAGSKVSRGQASAVIKNVTKLLARPTEANDHTQGIDDAVENTYNAITSTIGGLGNMLGSAVGRVPTGQSADSTPVRDRKSQSPGPGSASGGASEEEHGAPPRPSVDTGDDQTGFVNGEAPILGAAYAQAGEDAPEPPETAGAVAVPNPAAAGTGRCLKAIPLMQNGGVSTANAVMEDGGESSRGSPRIGTVNRAFCGACGFDCGASPLSGSN